jgi:hypothetical protein
MDGRGRDASGNPHAQRRAQMFRDKMANGDSEEIKHKSDRSPWSLGVLMASFVIINIGFILLFWGIRAAVMDGANYVRMVPNGRVTSGGINRALDSLFVSIAIQTTLGSDTDVVAVSAAAKWINAVQALTTLASWVVTIGIASIWVQHRIADAKDSMQWRMYQRVARR